MIYSSYEYIPRQVECEYIEYVPVNDWILFTTGYYKKVKWTKTVYDKFKKIPKINWFWYDLIPVK